ncbi:carbonic anhydrase, partial [Clavibacter lycopersici]
DAEALPPHIARLIAPIEPAVRRVAGDPVVPSEVDAGEVGREHLRDTVTRMLEASEMISDRVAAGSLAIVGANYKLLEGTAVPDVIVGDIPR